MRKEIVILIASAMTFIAIAKVGAIDPNRPHGEHEHDYKHEHEKSKRQKYTCPMHPEVISDHPGNCPKCGMKLVPLKQEKRRMSNAERPTPNRQSHETHQHEMEMSMRSSINLADPMSREGSGTSWLPDSTPM